MNNDLRVSAATLHRESLFMAGNVVTHNHCCEASVCVGHILRGENRGQCLAKQKQLLPFVSAIAHEITHH